MLMKARAVKEYIDRYTQEFHAVGDVVSLTDERFSEIARAGRYVEEVIQEEAPAKKAENPDNNLDQNPADQDPIGQTAEPADQDMVGEAANLADQNPVELSEPNTALKKPRRNRK